MRRRTTSGAYEIWDTETCARVRRVTVKVRPFDNCYRSFGRLLAVQEAGSLSLHNLETGERIRSIGVDYLTAVTASKDEKHVVVGGASRTHLVDMGSGEIRTIPEGSGHGRFDLVDISETY